MPISINTDFFPFSSVRPSTSTMTVTQGGGSVSVGLEVTGEANPARKAGVHVEHMWVAAVVEVDVVRALWTARFFCASTVRLVSAARARVLGLLREVGWSMANGFHVLRLMFSLMGDLFMQSSNRFFCPPPPPPSAS